MGRSIRLLLATALAAGTLTTISLATPSAAATKVSCAKEAGGKPVSHGSGSTAYLTVKALLSLCSPSVGGKGTSITTVKKTITSKTTWAGGKGTSTQTVTEKAAPGGRGKCKVGEARLLVTAKTTAGTGAALKVIPKGSIGKSLICLRKDSTSYLEPGTKATF